MSTRTRTRTRVQNQAVARQKAHGASLRAWLQDRAAAAAKRIEAARKKAAETPTSRGVDRVPAQYRGPGKPTPVVLVEHTDNNHATRRRSSRATGRSMRAGTNTPHINPARDRKAGARLRKELQS